MSTQMNDLNQRVARARGEILVDCLAGEFTPSDITRFGDLHDFVDANEYGDIASASPEMGNTVQQALDLWLRMGGLHMDEARARAELDRGER